MIVPGMLLSERYEIQEQIGSGGMAEVYKALDTRLNRLVAVKVLKGEFSNDKSFISRFKNEAKSAGALSHPNIVSVFDVGDDAGYHYIIMELVEGITLKKFIEKKGRLEVREAVGITIQIAQGMEAAHNNHIIHRDIKPQNIMISRDGKVKVADFGIAKVISSDTFTQNAVGSVHYLSPEQARGGYSDERSDIYSLGVTLYEMLTGVLPFGGDSDVTVALQHIQKEARPARDIVPTISYALDRVVQKCMQKHPENRYNSASELITDLKQAITNPDGDFVRFKTVSDNPTRRFTDKEVDEIKNIVSNNETTAIGTKRDKKQATSFESPKQIGTKTAVADVRNEQRRPAPKKKQPVNHTRLSEEIEELDTVDSKYEMIVIIIAVILSIGFLAFVSVVFVRFFNIPLFNGNTEPTPAVSAELTPGATLAPTQIPSIQMPNVTRQTFEDAVALLKAKSPDFSVVEEKRIYSSYEEGTVIDQYPPAYTDVLMTQTIRLTISAGPEPVKIPKLVGLTKEEMEIQMETLGFKVVIMYEANESIGQNIVIKSEPTFGTQKFAGDTVIVYVSTGAPVTYSQVPSVLGKSEAVAREMLTQAGFTVGYVNQQYSNEYKYGTVIEQSVGAGSTIDIETEINLVTSLGNYPAGITPSPAPGEMYYDIKFDLTAPNYKDCLNDIGTDENGEVLISFAIWQLGAEEEIPIILNYGASGNERYVEKVNISNVLRNYTLRIYADMPEYSMLREGDAEVILYIDEFIAVANEIYYLEPSRGE